MAFIGLTLKDTPTIVVPAGVSGLTFRLRSRDRQRAGAPELQAKGINAIVLLIHEGGVPTGDYNECPGISGPIVNIVKKLDKAVDLISGHTHRAYNCRIYGRLVTSGDKYGTVVTEIDLVLDPASGKVSSAQANNNIVRTEAFAKDPRQTELIAAYEKLARPLAQRVVGRIGAALGNSAAANGESPMGQVIADAQLAATRDAGAQIALMNPGGIRAPLPMPAHGLVRYENLFSVRSSNNNLVTMTLTGTQLRQLLEQQWAGQPSGGSRVMQVSKGFSYTWDASKPPGQRVLADSLRLNGQPVAGDATLRITVNSFMRVAGRQLHTAAAGPRQPHRHDGRRRAGGLRQGQPDRGTGHVEPHHETELNDARQVSWRRRDGASTGHGPTTWR